jgi:branched-chain amino acid transport system substrate-binding protein
MRKIMARIITATIACTLLAGCALFSPETDDSGNFPIAVVLDQTGVSSQLSVPIGAGIEAYVDHVNDSGGIDGRKVQIVETADSQSTVAGAQAAFQQVMQSEPLAVIGSVSTLGISGAVPIMANAGTPVMLAFAPDSLLVPPKPWLFTQVMPAELQMAASLSYLDKALGGLDGKRLAVSSAASSFGDAYVDAFENKSEELGFEVALVDRSSVTMTSFATNAAKIANSDADALLLLDVPSQTDLIVNDLAAAGFTKPVVGYESASDPTILESVASDQYVSFRGAPVPARSGPLAEAAQEAGVEDQLQSLWFSYGWNQAAILIEALSECGSDCDSSQLMTRIESTQDFTPAGDSTFGSVSYSTSKHYATTTVQFYTWDPQDAAEVPLLSPVAVGTD